MRAIYNKSAIYGNEERLIIESGSISQGYLYMQENNLPAAAFEGMQKNSKVKDLLYIGIAE